LLEGATQRTFPGFAEVGRGNKELRQTERTAMLIILGLLLVLLFFGLGFTLHVLWVVAIVLFLAWLIGLVVGRGESAGRNHFYRW
jgi:hypothetical protein